MASLFWLILGSLTVLRLFYLSSGVLDLSPDEAYYWEWSRHLDLSYYSKGPLIAYLIRGLTTLFGTSVFSIRLGAVVISLLGAWLLYRFGSECFGDRRVGFWSALALQVTPLFAAGSLLMTIDPPFFLFWLIAQIALYRAMVKGITHDWLVAGAAIGLGLLAKYTMLFAFPSIALYLLLTPEARRWIRHPAPYLGLLISLVLFSPVLVWNARHGWASIFHVASDGIGREPSASHIVQFFLGQVGVLTPLIAIALAWGGWFGWRQGVIGRREPHRFLMAFVLPIFFTYLLISIQTKVQANWPAAIYLPLMLVTVGAFVSRWPEWSVIKRRGAVVTVGLAFAIAGATSALAHDTSLLERWGISLDPKIDPTVRLMGWKELGRRVSQIAQTMPQPVFLFSTSYQVTSELAFYAEGRPQAYNVSRGRPTQYDFWEGPGRLSGWNAVYVLEGVRSVEPELEGLCHRLDRSELLQVTRGRRVVRAFSIFKCYDFLGSGPED